MNKKEVIRIIKEEEKKRMKVLCFILFNIIIITLTFLIKNSIISGLIGIISGMLHTIIGINIFGDEYIK